MAKTAQVWFSHVQNTNFVCSSISLNSTWFYANFIYIIDLDTLLQLLLISSILNNLYTTLFAPGGIFFWIWKSADCRRANPGLYDFSSSVYVIFLRIFHVSWSGWIHHGQHDRGVSSRERSCLQNHTCMRLKSGEIWGGGGHRARVAR